MTGGGHDSMPSWSPDGKDIYFIRTTDEIGIWPAQGSDRRYQMTVPAVMRVRADGSGDPAAVLDGHISVGSRDWFSWIRQPVLGPDGKTLAMVSDGPDPTKSDVVLQFYDLSKKKRTIPAVSEVTPLGHQDPAWRPDGKVAPLRPERPGGDARRAGDLSLGRGQEDVRADHRTRATSNRHSPRTDGSSRRRGRAASAMTS